MKLDISGISRVVFICIYFSKLISWHERDVHERDVHERDVHERDVHERDVHERDVHERDVHVYACE